MSVNGDEASLAPGSDSFWEPQNYKRTCKRIEDGHKLCDDMMKLVTERGEIEKNYAKSLKAWSKKWNELIEKGPEYGTAEAAWKAALVEADQRCELHLKVRDNLMNEVHAKVKQWQKDNFHKTMMHFKEKKEFDDGFRKAQKPWAKLLVKVNKTKADYHAACKTERTAQNQKLNASGDQSLSADALKKLADRVQKAEEDVAKSKERYDAALKDISDQNSKYIEDMTYVFNKCQDREGERLNFFKETMFGMHKCLNIGADPLLAQIYREFEHTVSSADKEKDLRWWSNNHGVNMPMNWPAFEEYTEQFRDIGGRSRRGAGQPADADGTITLIKQRQVIDDLPEYDPDAKPGSRKRAAAAQPGGAAAGEQASGQQSNSVSPNRSSQHSNGHGYEDGGPEEWDEYATELVDHGEPGVPVRAIYDYEGVEADELSFKAGEAFEKLEDEDEQGWCKGRKDGKVGLYPANYVQPV